MDEAFITAPFYPPSATSSRASWSTRKGERFVAEDSYHSRTSYHVMKQTDAAAYLILDSAHMAEPAMPLCPLIDGWETVDEMEAGLGLPAGSLVATLAAYNEHAARGEDPDFHKHPDWLAPQDPGPWGAFDLTLGTALYAGFTLGGMACDVDGRVLRERRDGDPRPVRRRRLRREHRAGRRRLLVRHPARRGVRTSVGGPGGSAAASRLPA